MTTASTTEPAKTLLNRLIFNRYLLKISWSTEGLWWTDVKDGSRQHYYVDFSRVTRTFEDNEQETQYTGYQIILGRLHIVVGDCLTRKPNRCE